MWLFVPILLHYLFLKPLYKLTLSCDLKLCCTREVWKSQPAFVLASRKIALLFCKQHLSRAVAQIVSLRVRINLFPNPFVAAQEGAEVTHVIPFPSTEQLQLWTGTELRSHLQSVASSHP